MEDLLEAVGGPSTKLQILRAIQERPKTGAEIARALDMDRSTIYRHMDDLAEGGLIQRRETNRKWVYVKLTPKGERTSTWAFSNREGRQV